MKTKHAISQVFAVVGILLLSLVVLWPLLKPGFFISDDAEWMVIRLSAFFQSLREGQFPVRFLGRLNQSYGYPVANFLYPGFFYIGSLIHGLGFSFPDTVKIIIGGSVVTGTVFSFLWLRTFYGLLPSFLGALGYLFAPYLVFDIYTRGSVGEVLAMSLVPVILYGIDREKQWFVPPAVGLLILAHNSLALLGMVFLTFYLAVRRMRVMIVPMLLGIGLAAFFWIPAIVERQFVVFSSVIVSNPSDYFLKNQQLYLVGIVSFVSFLALVFRKKTSAGLPFFLVIFAISVFLASTYSRIIWQIPIMGQLFQFPYRFLSLAVFSGAFLTATVVAYAKKYQYLSVMLFIMLLLVPVVHMVSRVDVIQRPLGYYTTNEATTTVADEYMPTWVKDIPEKRVSERLQFFLGNGSIDPIETTTQQIRAAVYASEESILQINTIYYPGWLVAIDAAAVPIDYDNPQGVMRVAVPSGNHTLVAQFRETPSRLAADSVSGISILLYGAYLIWMARTKCGTRRLHKRKR